MSETELKVGDRFLYQNSTEINSTIYEAVVKEITSDYRVKIEHINTVNELYYKWYSSLEHFDVLEIIENVNKKKKLKEIEQL
jgi:hypothetical protein